MTPLIPSLASESLVAFLTALKREDGPKLSAEDVEGLFAIAQQHAATSRRLALLIRTTLAKGMEAEKAKNLTTSMLGLLQRTDQAILATDELVGQVAAREPGPAPSAPPELRELHKQIKLMVEEAEGILELLARPRKPMTPEVLQKARESFERGTYRPIEDVLRERGML